MRSLIMTIAAGSLALLIAGPAAAAEQIDVRDNIDRGLRWLAKEQAGDGHWAANGGQYPTSMTALAGMAMLMEGSTLREGKYRDNLIKAVEWFMKRAQPSGLLGNPANPTEAGRYMYGHGFGLLFLASCYGEEDDKQRRKELERILTKAVEFCGKAQTTREVTLDGKKVTVGGWGYVSAADGGNFDEGSVTITQLQAVRAAKNAGIVVPKEIIDKATGYLHVCTTPRGGIIYSLTHGMAQAGQERPPLTAAAIACGFSAGEYESEYVKKWLKFCQSAIPIGRGRLAHDEYQSYYYAQVIWSLGDNRYAELFPDSKEGERLTWSGYRDAMFDRLAKSQNKDGSWQSGYIGTVFSTSVNLTILQLEKGMLPIYDR